MSAAPVAPYLAALASIWICVCRRCAHEWEGICQCLRRIEVSRPGLPAQFHHDTCEPPERCPRCKSRAWFLDQPKPAGRPRLQQDVRPARPARRKR